VAQEGRRSRFGAAGRLAFFPARVAARASRGPLEAAEEHLVPELSRLIDRALAQSLPEELVHSLVEHRVLERMAAEFAETGALDQAVENALASPHTQELTDRIVNSEQMRSAIREIVASPEVRKAVTQQTVGFVDELAGAIRARARRLDDRMDRGHAAATTPFAGVATRATALTADALLIIAIFTALSGFVALISSLVGTLRPTWLVGVLLGSGWTLVAGGYLVLFWSGTGRTPGMNLLRVRVRDGSGGPPSVGRAIVRALTTWISIVPFFAGYLPVLFDRRRRGLPDLVAGTEVVYFEPDG
jgi:uncharacterized RDD family membrane protein YckC